MALKKLSTDIQSLFSSSIHLFNYKRAVEELVYNALDAEATSIAIRIHIQENKIQVVDNGNGISKEDFNLLGQMYATSKFADMSRLQSAPNTYGFRGQALASVIDVSEYVNITSRLNNSEKTWTKTFYKGKSKTICGTTIRASKGTTVQINGFLYNLKIQSKAIKYLSELNDINTLLEQLALVHNNVSFSLRDDSKNDIIFKVHKNRDIYQTFKSLHDIEKSEVQELQVEKGQYKAKAYIAKQTDHIKRHHWIFLNKRMIRNSHLHKLVQNHLKKNVHVNVPKIKKTKINNHEDDVNETKDLIPFYFIFISCPYNDYDISNTPKQSTLEFKNWNGINKLLEKTVKFYTGDIKVNKIEKVGNKENGPIQENDIREQVKGIMNKILGGYPKNPGVSQMHNGIKGKLIKRKSKKKNKDKSISKILQSAIQDGGGVKQTINSIRNLSNAKIFPRIPENNSQLKIKLAKSHTKSENQNDSRKNYKTAPNNKLNKKVKNVALRKTINYKIKKPKFKKDTLVKAFEKQSDIILKRCKILSEQVEKYIPCNKEKKRKVYVNESINYSNFIKANENISIRRRVKETIIHDYIPLKRTEVEINHKQVYDLNKEHIKTSHDLIKTVLATHEEIASFPKETNHFTAMVQKSNLRPFLKEPNMQFPQLTFQSHHYVNSCITNNITSVNHSHRMEKYPNDVKKKHFISKRSLDNFVKANENNCMNKIKNKSRANKITSNIATKFNFSNGVSSYTIDFTETKDAHNVVYDINNTINNYERTFEVIDVDRCSIISSNTGFTIDYTEHGDIESMSHKNNYSVINNEKSLEFTNGHENSIGVRVSPNIGFTYTLPESICTTKINNQAINEDVAYSEQNCTSKAFIKYSKANKIEHRRDSLNVIFVSKSNPSIIEDTGVENVEPLNVCEAILDCENDTIYGEKNITNNPNQFTDSLLNVNSLKYIGPKKYDEKEICNLISPENAIITNGTLEEEMCNVEYNLKEMETLIQDKTINIKTHSLKNAPDMNDDHNEEQKEQDVNLNPNNFNLINRPRFLPKGMSPIFKTHNFKNTEDYNCDNDYFREEIYNKFMDSIQVHSEIYEANVQSSNDARTRAIDKVYNRINKENSSLIFNTQSLMEAKVLGQVDNKFIATIIKGKSDSTEFLVLFDQHAVHERIRLEDNLSGYYNGNAWKSAKLDDVIIKLSKDEVLYLHNYKDKFTPFGLQWTVLNNHEITLHAIPEAILGKNPKQVDKVIKAVKSLISEEVNMIKTQKGCTSLYPKSIMNLVFSEACRYAIMFGDRLSIGDCVELIRKLSSCKTPFQCAHGRPVMAVIMEVTSETRRYQINKEKLRNLMTSMKKQTI